MPQQVKYGWDAARRRMRKIGRLVRNDLSLKELQQLAPDPHVPVPRGPPPPLKDIMTLHDSLHSMGRKHARALELERLQQWHQSMGQAWLDKPTDVYRWIKNDYQAPRVMLKDPETGGPTANVNRMDEILHEFWDKVMCKYAASLERDPDVFVQKYRSFIESHTDIESTGLWSRSKVLGFIPCIVLSMPQAFMPPKLWPLAKKTSGFLRLGSSKPLGGPPDRAERRKEFSAPCVRDT